MSIILLKLNCKIFGKGSQKIKWKIKSEFEKGLLIAKIFEKNTLSGAEMSVYRKGD